MHLCGCAGVLVLLLVLFKRPSLHLPAPRCKTPLAHFNQDLPRHFQKTVSQFSPTAAGRFGVLGAGAGVGDNRTTSSAGAGFDVEKVSGQQFAPRSSATSVATLAVRWHQSVHQSVSESISQSVKELRQQRQLRPDSVNQSVHQSVSQSISQSVNQVRQQRQLRRQRDQRQQRQLRQQRRLRQLRQLRQQLQLRQLRRLRQLHVNYASYISDVSYVTYVSYVSYASYVRYVSYVSYLRQLR